MLLFLRPDVCQVQRDNFLRLVKRQNAVNPHRLAVILFSRLTRHTVVMVDDEMREAIRTCLWAIEQGDDREF
ncbi:MAG TPA: hypothetical protein VGL35_11500 [Rhizomicrobium sp.]|jgi:hypothetical protein